MELIFASNNIHKLNEARAILKNVSITGLMDLSYNADLHETHNSLRENAREKAFQIYKRYGKDCFADDTGLAIEALNGEPGVYSSRYAGLNKSFDDNMNKVIEKLEGIKFRKAIFTTVICFIDFKGRAYFFEGKLNGNIGYEKRGKYGFGYDPVFLPDGYNKTMSELLPKDKNKISHRYKALNEFYNFLKLNNRYW